MTAQFPDLVQVLATLSTNAWPLNSLGVWFFSKKNILIPNVAEKNILILVEKKKWSDSEFLSYNLMLDSGKKIRALRDKKK